jgi:hypothetical protein
MCKLKNGHIPCEICEINPAKTVKGGLNHKTGKHGFWLVCQECLNKIKDMRLDKR